MVASSSTSGLRRSRGTVWVWRWGHPTAGRPWSQPVDGHRLVPFRPPEAWLRTVPGCLCNPAWLRRDLDVRDGDTAVALRSGEVAVLGTPRLIALCEEASLQAIAGQVADGHTTVGMRVQLDHLAPTAVGFTVTAEARLDRSRAGASRSPSRPPTTGASSPPARSPAWWSTSRSSWTSAREGPGRPRHRGSDLLSGRRRPRPSPTSGGTPVDHVPGPDGPRVPAAAGTCVVRNSPRGKAAPPVTCGGMSDLPVAAIPSATVVPLRDGRAGLEVLMIERAAAIAYGGMWAFPGGRIDPGDADPAYPGRRDRRCPAGRRARSRGGGRAAVPARRPVPYSHWTGGSKGPPLRGRYFLAPAPDGEVVLDEGPECLAHRWIRPADAVTGRDRGEIAIVAPTWMTLHSLTDTRTVADAAGAWPTGDRRWPTGHGWPGSATTASSCGTATPATRPATPTVHGPRHRLVMGTAGWSFQASPAG